MSTTPSATRAVAVTVKVALRRVLGIQLHLSGASHLPTEPCVLAHNLVSPLDPFVMALALAEAGQQHPVVMLRNDLDRIPLLTSLLRAGALAVDNASPDESEDEEDPFVLASTALWTGRSIITAPEQVISRSLEILPVRSGPVRLSAATTAPLIPAALFGTHRLFDDSGKLRMTRRGVPVHISIGAPTPNDIHTDFLATQRILQFDLEALLAQTLDGYPDREQGEAGASWWPQSRGGSAPSLIETLDERPDPESGALELWADDKKVESEARRLGAPARDPRPSMTVPIKAQSPAELHKQHPDVWAPPVHPDNGVSGVTGLLAFDLPGQPRRVLRNVSIEVTGDTAMVVQTMPDPARLEQVQMHRHGDKTLFSGRLADTYRVKTGEMTMTVPAGTRTTLAAMRRSARQD